MLSGRVKHFKEISTEALGRAVSNSFNLPTFDTLMRHNSLPEYTHKLCSMLNSKWCPVHGRYPKYIKKVKT